MKETGAARYPKANAALDRLLKTSATPTAAPLAGFAIGPAVLRAPPETVSSAIAPEAVPLGVGDDGPLAAEAMLGELVDMVFVSADDDAVTAGEPKQHEVHLMFKADVLGGLHLRLRKTPAGMVATFVVEDAAARRAVADHVDGLVEHLKGKGFSIVEHTIELAGT